MSGLVARLEKFSSSGIFLRNAFSRFFNAELCEFFEKQGLALKVERGGRVFPQSDLAGDVLAALAKLLKESNVRILCNSEVSGVKRQAENFWVIMKDNKSYFAKKILLATGGLSYPATGSSGFGLKEATRLGHTVIEPRPGLVGVRLKGALPKCWQGISLKNVECRLTSDGKLVAKEFGEMLFTHFGVSGPIILDLSALVFDLVKDKKEVMLTIDFKPALTAQKLDNRLLREFLHNPNKQLNTIFKDLLPAGLIEEFLRVACVSAEKRGNQVSKEERRSLVYTLKKLTFAVTGTRPIQEAIVTRGGISTKEINPKTMESRIIPGLFFCGEIIDVDALTGGYNMQAAFSTGYIAGASV